MQTSPVARRPHLGRWRRPGDRRRRLWWRRRAPQRVSERMRGGGLEPDGAARQGWIFQGFTSADIRW